MDKNNFSDWLREQMRAKGWRQVDLAHAAHVDPAVVSNILNMKRGPGIETCTAFAQALGLEPGVVMQAAGLLGRRSTASNDAYAAEIINIYEKFTMENKREVLEFVRLLLRLQEEQAGIRAADTSAIE